jgi:hypothetical protein
MTTLLLIVMVLLLIIALERADRRQSPHAPGLYGAHDHNDRDWARTELDLLALGGDAEPPNQRHPTATREAPASASGSRQGVMHAKQSRNDHHQGTHTTSTDLPQAEKVSRASCSV